VLLELGSYAPAEPWPSKIRAAIFRLDAAVPASQEPYDAFEYVESLDIGTTIVDAHIHRTPTEEYLHNHKHGSETHTHAVPASQPVQE
jgi:hypothetical protein